MSPIERAAELLARARHAVALTGAGVSTPSGIPDFRSPGRGLWERADPLEVASVSSFRRKPEAFFEWFRPLAQLLLSAQPNPAHLALAQMEQAGWLKAVITQNIDGLHQKAGSRQVLEVHGHVRAATCIRCYHSVPTEPLIETLVREGGVPCCPLCGNVLKPNAILFGEQLPAAVMRLAQRHTRECDVMLVAGSSLEVAPVSDLPLWARRQGARLILINWLPTFLDEQADLVFHADVAEVLPRLAQACGWPSHEHI